jgi:hypothetical protein
VLGVEAAVFSRRRFAGLAGLAIRAVRYIPVASRIACRLALSFNMVLTVGQDPPRREGALPRTTGA